MHICVGKLTAIGLYNGLSPRRHQAIILTNAGILLIWPMRTNYSEIEIEINSIPFKKMYLRNVICEMAAILSRPQSVKILQKTMYGPISGNTEIIRLLQIIRITQT